MKLRVEGVYPNAIGLFPVVLMDKKLRESVGIDDSELALVVNEHKVMVAIVAPAKLKDVGRGLMIDDIVARVLDVKVGSVVSVLVGQRNEQMNLKSVMMN